ncbi:hypothetical protein IAD21_05570 [Abditibacteriota bacterium]|nr:hypothetical protein IAD21_05570 [Abditibacteriota bacterium]
MDSVTTTIDQCMQRGERPLSVIDLIEKDLITLNQAAWLVSRIEEGSSWLVGAIPGHAGKTTLMSALLVFIQAQEQATLAEAWSPWESFGQNCCVVAEEISDHNRGRYLWDEDVHGLTAIPARGGRIAATIHATTLEQVRDQISRQCGAGESAVTSFGIFIPIEVTYEPGSPSDGHSPEGRRRRAIRSRTVEVIHYYDSGQWNTIDREIKLTGKQESISFFLRSCLESGIDSCEALRKAWLAER